MEIQCIAQGTQSKILCPGQVARLVTASSQCTKVAGSVPGWGSYKNQPMNGINDGTTLSLSFSLSLYLSLSLSLSLSVSPSLPLTSRHLKSIKNLKNYCSNRTVMDDYQTQCGYHITRYVNVESLCCKPEVNIILYVSYTLILNNLSI